MEGQDKVTKKCSGCQQEKALANLRPLEAKENMKKGAKL
jgi:hypothetical protein